MKVVVLGEQGGVDASELSPIEMRAGVPTIKGDVARKVQSAGDCRRATSKRW